MKSYIAVYFVGRNIRFGRVISLHRQDLRAYQAIRDSLHSSLLPALQNAAETWATMTSTGLQVSVEQARNDENIMIYIRETCLPHSSVTVICSSSL
jgi:hypothetical protein